MRQSYRVFIGIAALWMLLWGAGIYAQDEPVDEFSTPTPTALPELPTPQYVVYWAAESAFPQGIAFELLVFAPSNVELSRLQLTLTPDESAAMAFDVPLSDVLIEDAPNNNRRVLWVWQPSDVAALPLFLEALTYQWDVSFSDGTQDAVLDRVVFEDVRSPFTLAPDALIPITLGLPTASTLNAARVLSGLQQVYILIAANSQPLPTPLIFLVYTDETPIGCATDERGRPIVNVSFLADPLPCQLNRANAIYARSGYEVRQVPQLTLPALYELLVREMVDRMYADFWAVGQVPAWFAEGLYQLYSPAPKFELFTLSQTAVRGRRVVALSALQTPPHQDAGLAYVEWQAQSYGMVIYMAEQSGLEAVYRVARLEGNGDFADIYARATGANLLALVPSWELWMLSSEAQGVYTVDIYAAPTVTPRPFSSPTPIPPTRTPFPTFTPSPTPTITPTALPPTRTPTVTPRPASSVATPFRFVPQPPPPAEAPFGLSAEMLFLLVGGGFGLAIGAVVLLILAILRRRRR